MSGQSTNGKGKEKEAMKREDRTECGSSPPKPEEARGNLVGRLQQSSQGLGSSLFRSDPWTSSSAANGAGGKVSPQTPSSSSHRDVATYRAKETARGASPKAQTIGKAAESSSSPDFSNFIASTDTDSGAGPSTSRLRSPPSLFQEAELRSPGQWLSASPAQNADGQDVVLLLSAGEDPAFDPGASPSPTSPLVLPALHDTLFSDTEGQEAPQWQCLLDFEPTALASEDEALQLFGTRDLSQARASWLGQWEAVLVRYTDEVWGSLSPMVKEAKAELDEAKTSQPHDRELAGLERLRLILQHVRGGGHMGQG